MGGGVVALCRLLLIALSMQCCLAYNAIPRSSMNGGYSSSSSYTSTTSGSSGYMPMSAATMTDTSCCVLNRWAYDHMDEVRQFADRLRQEYNRMSQGNSAMTTHTAFDAWKDNIMRLTGKSALELDAAYRDWSQQLISDMRNGALSYNIIAQPNFFESKAADILQGFINSNSDFGQQQHILDVGHFQPMDLSNYDEVKNYAYPAEVKVINGKTYVVHKNCTEATRTMGEGTLSSPLITVLKRNRTVITSSGGGGVPTYTDFGGASNTNSRVVSHNIYSWVDKNMEPSVVGYNPTISIGPDWSSGSFIDAYKPTDGGYYQPENTVTIHRYNQTIIKNSNGTDSVSGSQVRRKWVNGRLVVDEVRPFGEGTGARDDDWMREERERFFWFLSDGGVTTQALEEWQRQQEERLLAMAQRYKTSIETIQDWHYKELERYRALLGQYRSQTHNNLSGWKAKECGRLDWLIHQNSVTREELERWQRENFERLQQLARNYRITVEELKSWQMEELNRLYVYFEEQNNSINGNYIPSSSLHATEEQERLEALIRQHNATITQLQNSIYTDQLKLNASWEKYRGNVTDMEKWLRSEVERLAGIIKEQRNELTRITEWQNSERQRMETLLRTHRGSIAELEAQMAADRHYIQSLASKYHVSIEELEKWQRAELERLQYENKIQMELNVKAWQAKEHENLMAIIKRNDLTIEEFQTNIMNDRARLEDLARTYKVQVSEVEDWIKQELKTFQSQGLLKEVEKELAAWQQKERERLLAIVQQNEISMEELEQKIKNDQSRLVSLASTYQVRVEEIEEWLKKEFLRLQKEGLVKVEDLKDWQQRERLDIMNLVQQNKLTIEEFEQKLLTDRDRLQDLSRTYNVQISEIENWIREEGKRLENLGLLQMQEELNRWQKIERERLLSLINKNNLSLEELEERIQKDHTHLYSLAHQHQVRVEEIEEWIRQEIRKLQQQGWLEMEKLKDWQTEWRGNLTNMVQERDFTVEEFHKWLLADRARLQNLAKVHNVQIEEIEQWVRNEEQRFVSMGLLKPNEKLTNWQEAERRYLQRIAQEQQFHSTEQLEQRLRQDRELLEQLARRYSIQVEEVEQWMKKELSRLRDEGQLQIDNLTAWQLAERERLEAIVNSNKQWSLEDFEATLRKDREYMQKLAFQYHTSMEEVEQWIQSEITRLQQQGKLDIQNLSAWQQAEQQRILKLLENQSSITAEEFERKVQQDYAFLQSLANEYHISVMDVESYVRKVIDELKQKGKFEVQNLQTWQIVERDYIKQLISQYNNGLSTTEFEQKLLADRAHLHQLAEQYRLNVDQIEKWMLEELRRLRNSSETEMQHLATWQVNEVQRIKELIRENNHIDYVAFEMELIKERNRLANLAKQYAINVEQIEAWLRQQLLNLKTTGQVQVENLTNWQAAEQKRLIELLLAQQNNVSFEEFEAQIRSNHTRLQQLAQVHSVSVEQIERWMHNELQRLQSSGLVQVEHLNTWQRAERERLEQWIKQFNHNVSYAEILDFLKRDESRLQQIAREYQITVEEVETWVQLEAARLQFLNMIKQPVMNEVTIIDDNALWKVHTKAHLRGIAQARPMSWQDFEAYLARERMRWQHMAQSYGITVEEIEVWLRQAAQELRQEGLIYDSTAVVEEWQTNEQLYIQNLINEALRKNRIQWSLEELECLLTQDRAHLEQLAREYHITVETIETWYNQELQRLLALNKIISSIIQDWQRRERIRIYGIVLQQPLEMRTVSKLESILLQDQNALSQLAANYHVTVEELRIFINEEIRRLRLLGILTYGTNGSSSSFSHWQQAEKQRLRTIATQLKLTEWEFLDFIAADYDFQQQLSTTYSCGLNQLAPYQRIEISNMKWAHLLEDRNLKVLESWQVKERDRIYNLIKNQNFTLRNLRDWQRRDAAYINEQALKYGISADSLKSWQLQEYERIMRVATAYGMSLHQLQDFREKELRWMSHVMHRALSSDLEWQEWESEELRRWQLLERSTGLSGEALVNWRRRLYLLCQGYISLDSGNNAGGEIGNGTTNVTAIPHPIISKDRGDQPPHMYEENIDSQEPGLEGEDPVYPSSTVRVPTLPPITQRPIPYVSTTARTAIVVPGSQIESGYRYTKKEYTITAPVGLATASATSNMNGSSASASVVSGNYYHQHTGHAHGRRNSEQGHGRDTDAELIDDGGQQQQQEEIVDFGQQQQQEEIVDFGQQQQQTEDFRYGQHDRQQQQSEDFRYGQHDRQQQQQIEDFGQQQQVELNDYRQSDNLYQQHQQQSHENPMNQSEAHQQSTVVAAEPEKSGFWNNLKKKTSDLFG